MLMKHLYKVSIQQTSVKRFWHLFIKWLLNVFRYQNELPKKIKARGKDAHLNHEELVQLMKWKQCVSLMLRMKLNILSKI